MITKITRKLSEDLTKALPNMKGFGYSNLRYMQRFAENYPDLLVCQQPVGKLENNNDMVIFQQLVGKLDDPS